ncbi:MAG: ABC transporter ATP-binding protein, partial [Acidimicrobiales bacterium]
PGQDGMSVAPAPSTDPVLEVDGIRASYGSYRALFGVSLSVPQRGIVALLGSNGAGKSTTARVISGLVPATGGSVRLTGTDITRMAAHRRARLGLTQVPEGRAIFSSLSVEENLQLAFRSRAGRAAVPAALERAFEAFPVLSQRRNQYAGTLSGGEQRILSLAKVLAVPPKVLIVDELSLGLAPSVVDTVYEGLVAIRETGTALLVVEQQIDRALEIADSAVLLARGSVAWSGPASAAGAAMEQLLGGSAQAASAEREAPRANGPAAVSSELSSTEPEVGPSDGQLGAAGTELPANSPGAPVGGPEAAPPSVAPPGAAPPANGPVAGPSTAPGAPPPVGPVTLSSGWLTASDTSDDEIGLSRSADDEQGQRRESTRRRR